MRASYNSPRSSSKHALRVFQDKFLHLVLFSLKSSLSWELRDKKIKKQNTILIRKPRGLVRVLIHRTWAIGFGFTSDWMKK